MIENRGYGDVIVLVIDCFLNRALSVFFARRKLYTQIFHIFTRSSL